MIIKHIVDEDFINYKKPAMYIALPYCDFKCEKGFTEKFCQNSHLVQQPNIEIDIDELISRYRNNKLTKAIVFGGLEPFLSYIDIVTFIQKFRSISDDDVIIYTGYNESEISQELYCLSKFTNIIVKFGRYIPNKDSIYDDILGVTLASNNQYAKIISGVNNI